MDKKLIFYLIKIQAKLFAMKQLAILCVKFESIEF